MGGDRQAPAPPDLHAGDTLVPSLYDLAAPQAELERLIAVPRGVELLAVRPGDPDIMNRHVLAGAGFLAAANREVLDHQVSRRVPAGNSHFGLVHDRSLARGCRGHRLTWTRLAHGGAGLPASRRQPYGDVAQWLEHLLCTQGVVGSSPIVSTRKNAGHGPSLPSCLLVPGNSRARYVRDPARLRFVARRGFGNLRKLPSGRWQASYWHDGRRHVAPATFGTKTDAQAWLATQQADIVRGAWTERPSGKVTFADYSASWMGRQSHLRPRTDELYRFLLQRHLLPTFGPMNVSAITGNDVLEWHRHLVASVPGTAPKCFRLLRQVLGAAVDDGFLAKSPAVIKGASQEARRREVIPTAQQVRLLAESVDPRYRAMVWLAGACGLRFGELAALRPERVDMIRREVHVVETVTEVAGGEPFVGPPKTEAGRRTVSIPSSIMPPLAEHLQRTDIDLRTLLFPAPEGGYLRRQNFRKRIWQPALAATGLEFRFHDLRHAAMTIAAASGATVADLMARAGHSSPRAALIYQHASRERDQLVADAMNKLLAEV